MKLFLRPSKGEKLLYSMFCLTSPYRRIIVMKNNFFFKLSTYKNDLDAIIKPKDRLFVCILS